MMENLELVGLVACQLLGVGTFIWLLIDGGFFERKPIVIDLGRVDIYGNWAPELLYTEAGAGRFQGVVQGTGAESVKSFDRFTSYFQRETTEGDSQGAGQVHDQSGESISREVRSGEGEGSANGSRASCREYLERRAIECGLFGPRVNEND